MIVYIIGGKEGFGILTAFSSGKLGKTSCAGFECFWCINVLL